MRSGGNCRRKKGGYGRCDEGVIINGRCEKGGNGRCEAGDEKVRKDGGSGCPMDAEDVLACLPFPEEGIDGSVARNPNEDVILRGKCDKRMAKLPTRVESIKKRLNGLTWTVGVDCLLGLRDRY